MGRTHSAALACLLYSFPIHSHRRNANQPRHNVKTILDSVLAQNLSSTETRAVVQAVSTMDDAPALWRTDIAGLSRYKLELQEGRCLPVGSVEFVRAALKVGGHKEPEPMGFPSALRQFYCRRIEQVSVAEARVQRCFVKPVQTKLFTGFVHQSDGAQYDEHDQEQLDVFNNLPEKTPVWVSDIVTWQSEYRYYVDGIKVLGWARYDQNESNDVPTPSLAFVQSVVKTLRKRHPYALDVGVLAGGQSAVVEINDAWALGLYQGALTPERYLRFLADRWSSMSEKRIAHHAHHAGALI